MGLWRRFQNLVLDNHFTGAKSLFSVDLTRQLFGNTATPPSTTGDRSEPAVVQDSTSQTPVVHAGNQKNRQATGALKMERIRLASPILTFQSLRSALNEPCKIECFPLVDRKMIWADHLGRPFLFDAETRQMEILPVPHKSKWMPFSLFVPNVDADNSYDHQGTGSSLYIMERIPKPEANCSTHWSNQFEVFVYKPSVTSYFKSWQCQLLPPPPYIREPKYQDCCSGHEISSYAVVGIGNSFYICISVKGIGTYCLDTAHHTWRKVGKWTLPFHGRVEYVPELKLWFGLTATGHLAAADLSAIDSQPQLVSYWKQLYMPEEWKQSKDSQFVNLGSGRFCIARFFHARTLDGGSGGDVDENIAVFTSVEVVRHVQDANSDNGGFELRMIPHKSLCHKSTGVTIDAVF
ncbi:unnamed protein product [Urochloa decumbens]|uniref:Uncharacterized protein n=1 Tax=Urochloa decumbens TaxID=240449 RepID=A0ABC8V8J2_9POAL